MTDGSGSSGSEYKSGDVVNGHILTAAGWLPLRRRPVNPQGPYYAGDVVGERVFTGAEWVPVDPTPKAAAVGGASAPPAPALDPSAGRGWLVWVAATIAVLVALGVLGRVVGRSNDEAPSAATESTATPTPEPKTKTKTQKQRQRQKAGTPKPVPALDPTAEADRQFAEDGWAKMGDGFYVKVGDGRRDDYSTVWRVAVITLGGCPDGVYVEGRITDTNGVVVDTANGTLLSLPAEGVGTIDVISMNSNGQTFTLNKASCY